ncbi:molybdopterin-dependent oxidoreductase [Microvirga zambiensis]|uniref:molybdopterin-dependent oxidoreductase n=1 Tax=Microvirga zambiensis TaxID=1402137 RepID=UPI001FE87256|nr:molybdopterin-dependent oxidoreductase [Microvirga zambiensis]
MGALVAFVGVIGVAYAATLAAPTERAVLTITGKIAVTNKDNTAQFDRPMLESLGMVAVETTTPWHEGKVKFEGIPVDKLMKQVGATGDRVVVTALNDYTTEIPMEDFAKYKVILAIKRNGEYMPVRDKGPLFIIYPYDSDPELKSQTYYARSAWQVAKIDVR